MELWKEIERLAGQTLHTLDQGKAFDVVSVDEHGVVVRVGSTGKERPIPRSQIQLAWDELRRRGELTLVRIQDAYAPVNPTYVSAILAALPGVEHTIRPIRLSQKD